MRFSGPVSCEPESEIARRLNQNQLSGRGTPFGLYNIKRDQKINLKPEMRALSKQINIVLGPLVQTGGGVLKFMKLSSRLSGIFLRLLPQNGNLAAPAPLWRGRS